MFPPLAAVVAIAHGAATHRSPFQLRADTCRQSEEGARPLPTGKGSTRPLPGSIPPDGLALNIQRRSNNGYPRPPSAAAIIGAAPRTKEERGGHDGSRQSDITHHHGHYRAFARRGSAFARRTAGSVRRNGQQETARRCNAAWKGIKELPPDDPRSFFNARRLSRRARSVERAGDLATTRFLGGYCNHGNVLFPHVAQSLSVEVGRGAAEHPRV